MLKRQKLVICHIRMYVLGFLLQKELSMLTYSVLGIIFQGSEEDCHRLGVRHKALIEIRKLRQQLTKIINSKCTQNEPLTVKLDMKPPTDEEMLMLRSLELNHYNILSFGFICS